MPLDSGIMDSGSVTTTVANTMLVACVAVDNQSDFITVSNSFTKRAETSSGTPDAICADRYVSTTGTYNTVALQILMPTSWQSAGFIIALRDSDQATFNANQSSMLLTMM
jgi:hypothetical protein